LCFALLFCVSQAAHRHAGALVSREHLRRDVARMHEEEDEEIIPVVVIVAEILISLVAGFIAEELKRSGAQACLQVSPHIFTGGQRVRMSELRHCRKVPATFRNDAAIEKHYHVHSHYGRFGIIPTKCLFEFAWMFTETTSFYDCTGAKELAENQRGIFLDAEVAISKCELKDHLGYVRVFPSMPESVMTVKGGKKVPIIDAEEKMRFHINVEGWTAGECSGDKAPGVSWMFTYLVDLRTFTITYVTKMVAAGEGRRPSLNENTYVMSLPRTQTSGPVSPEWLPVAAYEEKTLGFSEYLGVGSSGSSGE